MKPKFKAIKCGKVSCKKVAVVKVLDGWMQISLCELHKNDFPKGKVIHKFNWLEQNGFKQGDTELV